MSNCHYFSINCSDCFTYEIMDEFYLSLLSDSSMDIFPKNKQFSFTTKLNHPIQVQKEQWVVALVEIMTPSEVYNISHNSNYFYVHFYDENVLERLGKSKMNTVCMKDGSCPEIKLFIHNTSTLLHITSTFKMWRCGGSTLHPHCTCEGPHCIHISSDMDTFIHTLYPLK